MRPGLGIDVLGQRLRVGRHELRQLPPLEHHVDELGRLLRQVLPGRQIVEQVGARLPLARLGAAAARQLQAVEQELAQLPRRAQIELVAGQRVDLLLQPGDALGERGGEPRQDRPVDLHAGTLHLGEHRDQGPLQRLVDGRHALGGEAGLQHHPQPQRHVGVLGGVLRRLVERHLAEGLVRLLGAGRMLQHLLEGDADVPEVPLGERIHAVDAAGPGIERIGQQQGVVERRQGYAVLARGRGSRISGSVRS